MSVTPPQARSRRRLVHRIPIPLRQHWRLLAMSAAVALGLTVLFGPVAIRPYITGDVRVLVSGITDNISGTVDLFDSSVQHTLTIDISAAEYRDMIATFARDGDKRWVSADVTIDGTVIADAAVRLKGNSTLMGLRGDGPPPLPPGGVDRYGLGEAMGAIAASADDPTSLPLLISFDENAAGRAYQGMTELSVRPGSPVLNESLALELTAATDQPTQRYAYVSYEINGQAGTRLVLEHPDETYANSLFASDGYLYKADANSQLEFLGTDQSRYADQFKQINAVDSGDLTPLINFLSWLDGAEGDIFDAELADWVDVDSLARYLATQHLLVNADDMAGPGQNYYLWFDLETQKFSVLSWDLNLAMVGDVTVGPDEVVRLPMPPMGSGHAPPSGMPAPPDGMPGRGPGGGMPGPGPGGGFPRIGNPLKTKFVESPKWQSSYHDAYWSLYRQMYADGAAHRTLGRIAAAVPVSAGLDSEKLTAAVDSLRSKIDQRVAALEKARPK